MRRPNKRQRILDESLVLFSKYGYDSVPTRKIASASDVTEGAIYRHFDSKREILDEIFSLYKRKMNEYNLTDEQINEYIKTDTPKEFLKRAVIICPDDDKFLIAHASRIVYRESLVHNVPNDINIHKICENVALKFKYMLDLLIKRNSIPKIDTQIFSFIWAQSFFSCSADFVSTFIDSKSEALHVESNYIKVTAYLIDMAISGKLKENL